MIERLIVAPNLIQLKGRSEVGFTGVNPKEISEPNIYSNEIQYQNTLRDRCRTEMNSQVGSLQTQAAQRGESMYSTRRTTVQRYWHGYYSRWLERRTCVFQFILQWKEYMYLIAKISSSFSSIASMRPPCSGISSLCKRKPNTRRHLRVSHPVISLMDQHQCTYTRSIVQGGRSNCN